MAQVPATSYESTSLGDVAEFTIPFPFLSRAEVFVTVDGAQSAFTWINDGLIQLPEIPELGAIVRRYRSTAAYVPLHQFSQGVPFLPRYVDRDFTQTLYAVQESVNDTAGTAALAMDTAEVALDTAQDALALVGERTQYMVLGPYGPGLHFQTTSQVFSYLGEFYAPGPAITLPYTTTGAGAGEIANFRSVGDAVLRSDLAASTGAERVGWKRSQPVSGINTVSEMLDSQTRSLWEYANLVTYKPDANDPKTWDWSPAIQAAIDELASLRGGLLLFPRGVFKHSASIQLKAFVSVRGEGSGYDNETGTVLWYTGTGDGWFTQNAINTSAPMHCSVEDLTFYAPGISIYKGAFADLCGTELHFARVSFLFPATAAGLILDQTEISDFTSCHFFALGFDPAARGACVWLVNGPSRTPGVNLFFTNRIAFLQCNFNPHSSNARCVVDEGGLSHEFLGCNWNGGSVQFEGSAINGLRIVGGEMEASTGAHINLTRGVLDVGTPAVEISGIFHLVVPGSIGVNIPPGVCDHVMHTNNVYSASAGTAVTNINGTTVTSFGNISRDGAAPPFNNYNTLGTTVPTVLGSITPGAHTYVTQSSNWRRNGDQTTVSVNIALTTKDAAMAGSVDIDCLPTPVTGDFQAGGVALYNGVTLPAGHTQIGIATVPGTTRVRLYTAGSAAVGAALGAAGISGAFAITFTVTYF